MGRGRDFREPRQRGFDDNFGGGNDRAPFRSEPPRDDRARSPFGGPPASRAPSSGPEQEATVKWFNSEKGFGFVQLSDGTGDAFMHIRAVEAAGHSDMQPGTKLTVRTAQGQKGPQVTEILTVDTSTAEAPAPRREAGARPPRFGGGDRFGGGGGYGGGGGGGYGGGGGDRFGGGGGGGGGGRFNSGPSTEMNGTVKWYDAAKGFGFVSVDDGGKDVFVHRSALARAGLASLNEGQQVTMGVVEGQKGREASTINVLD